jgi:hypothetical protein
MPDCFKIFCEEIGSEHTALLLHKKGEKLLVRVLELHSESSAFFVQHLSHCLTSAIWLQKLA